MKTLEEVVKSVVLPASEMAVCPVEVCASEGARRRLMAALREIAEAEPEPVGFGVVEWRAGYEALRAQAREAISHE